MVVEVDRPDRKARRAKGKSDPLDAYSAARAALAGTASGVPKTRDGRVETIRALRVARSSAVKARSQTTNQLKSLLVTGPAELREQLRELSATALVVTCARLRPTADLADPEQATKAALRRLARRHQYLSEEIAVHDSGVSVTYAMESMVSATVRDQVLRRLLEPHRDIARKRITLIYRPHDAGDAATIVDRDHKDAIIAASRKGLVAAAADVALEATTRARDEEARGAGVVRFSILMTTTVADPDQLRRTDAVLRTLAATARLKVRPCYGYQAAAFAAALGVGVLLPEHATIPGALAN